MTSSEDFKQAIKTGNLDKAFNAAMSNASKLSITTKIITSEGDRVDGDRDNYLHTHINLVEGKIENEIGEKLTGDRYAEIQQFHLRQVSRGHQTIQQNLISLQKMFQSMSAFQKHSRLQNWVDIAADVDGESSPPQPKIDRLCGKTPDALPAPINKLKADLDTKYSNDETSDNIIDDLIFMAYLDDDLPIEEFSEDPEDWKEWLEDESGEPELDINSLNISETQKSNASNSTEAK